MKALLFRHIFTPLVSFCLGLYVVPLMIKLAYKIKFLDHPDGVIKQHGKEVPYLGGLAVFISFFATLILFFPLQNYHHVWFFAGITLLLCIGLVDDLLVLWPRQKFLGQLLAVLCFLKGGISLRVQFFSTYFNIAASVFWMLSIINAFNLVDVMDGLSSVIALTAAASFLAVALMLKQYTLSLLLLAMIGSLCAFLVYNKPSAKIYLGDAGSLFLGGFFAALPLLFSWSTMHLQGYIAPILILGVPLLEVASLVVIRTYKRIPFYRASPDHFAFYLKRRHWSVPRILFFTAAVGCSLGSLAILFLCDFVHFFHLVGMIICVGIVWFATIFYHELKRLPISQTRSVADIIPAFKIDDQQKKQIKSIPDERSKRNTENSSFVK